LWYACVSATDPGTGKPVLSARSIKRYTATLSSLHSFAAGEMKPPPANPVSEDVSPRIDQASAKTATPILEKQEVAAVAAQATCQADLVLIGLLYVLAGRVSEICAADVEDLHTVGRRTFLAVTRKGGQNRELEIPLALAELIDLYLGGRTSGPILLNSLGQRMDRFGALWISASLGRAAGVLAGRDLTPHVWRASRITHLLDDLFEQGGQDRVMAGLPQVMIFANHKNPETTLRYWARRNHADRNAELSRTGEQVLADTLHTWLEQAGGLLTATTILHRNAPPPN
jgi:integrase